MNSLVIFCSIVCVCIALGGCTTPEEYAAERREKLLTAYPPGTTRAEVQKRWAPIHPNLSETRPIAGWSASTQPAVRARASRSEERTGHTVYRCERYFGPDGWSGGLCYGWFFYDDQDQVVDAEWQWHTD